MVKHRGGPNHTYVEKCGDELWIAEKFQSNSEIAKALNGLGAERLLNPIKL